MGFSQISQKPVFRLAEDGFFVSITRTPLEFGLFSRGIEKRSLLGKVMVARPNKDPGGFCHEE
jgi:hypothetical protein